jgi:hypothetical protein
MKSRIISMGFTDLLRHSVGTLWCVLKTPQHGPGLAHSVRTKRSKGARFKEESEHNKRIGVFGHGLDLSGSGQR